MIAFTNLKITIINLYNTFYMKFLQALFLCKLYIINNFNILLKLYLHYIYIVFTITRYKISTSSWSKQLPTAIVFENGTEVLRQPRIDFKGKVRGKFIFSEVYIINVSLYYSAHSYVRVLDK